MYFVPMLVGLAIWSVLMCTGHPLLGLSIMLVLTFGGPFVIWRLEFGDWRVWGWDDGWEDSKKLRRRSRGEDS